MTIDLEKLIDRLEMAKNSAEHNAKANQGDSATYDRGRYAGLKEALDMVFELADK